MPKICYVPKNFKGSSRTIIDAANEIIAEYQGQGYTLTLRQLYYQFVARDLIPNKQSEYKRIGAVISDARIAGEIDWYAIEDRTRALRGLAHWSDPSEIIESCAAQYTPDLWDNQHYRPEVWIEKDALVGVIDRVCTKLDVPYFSCRGYTSLSEMWKAGQRLEGHRVGGQIPLVVHLGDHDPSGMDMTRDILDRLELFAEGRVEVKRIALNMDQVREHNPPPNPAKLTDSRAGEYIASYGYDSWELDALDPATLSTLIEGTLIGVRDEEKWDEAMSDRLDGRAKLTLVAENWGDVSEYVEGI